mgnify:CR=1 FL=1
MAAQEVQEVIVKINLMEANNFTVDLVYLVVVEQQAVRTRRFCR